MSRGPVRIVRYSLEHMEEARNALWEHAYCCMCQGDGDAYDQHMDHAARCCFVIAYMELNHIRFIEKDAMLDVAYSGPISTRKASGLTKAEAIIAARPSKSIGYFRKLMGQIFGGLL